MRCWQRLFLVVLLAALLMGGTTLFLPRGGTLLPNTAFFGGTTQRISWLYATGHLLGRERATTRSTGRLSRQAVVGAFSPRTTLPCGLTFSCPPYLAECVGQTQQELQSCQSLLALATSGQQILLAAIGLAGLLSVLAALIGTTGLSGEGPGRAWRQVAERTLGAGVVFLLSASVTDLLTLVFSVLATHNGDQSVGSSGVVGLPVGVFDYLLGFLLVILIQGAAGWATLRLGLAVLEGIGGLVGWSRRPLGVSLRTVVGLLCSVGGLILAPLVYNVLVQGRL